MYKTGRGIPCTCDSFSECSYCTIRRQKDEIDSLRSELEQVRKERDCDTIPAWVLEHDKKVLQELYDCRLEFEQIRKDLKGHPDSILSGENGLAQATMRGFEQMRDELEQEKHSIQRIVRTLDSGDAYGENYEDGVGAIVMLQEDYNKLLAERTRAEKAEKERDGWKIRCDEEHGFLLSALKERDDCDEASVAYKKALDAERTRAEKAEKAIKWASENMHIRVYKKNSVMDYLWENLPPDEILKKAGEQK
jgi:hypothetical protein